VKTESALSMKNDLADLTRLMGEIEAVLRPHALNSRTRYRVRLVVEEILTNIIKYAFPDDDPHEISVRLKPAEDRLTIEFEDDGAEFDPRSAPPPDLSASLEETSVGGLGLHLVRANVEKMEYLREGPKNRLTVELSVEHDHA
jgi:serine/threonine-protein kinase RsbW